MIEHSRPTGLQWWAGPGQDLGCAYEAVRSHPRVGEAGHALVGAMLDLVAADPALLTIFKDAGRYSTAMWAFYLDQSGELTAPALCGLSFFLNG